jgi:uncharacterized membrane protein
VSPTPTGGRCRRDRGAVIQIVAILLPVLLTMTAFAVDLGRQRSSRRTMQARADIVALDMVRFADGRTEQAIIDDPGYLPYLRDSASKNHALELFERGDLVVEYGTWNATSDFVPTAPTGVPTAVKVTADDEVDYFFKPGSGTTSRSAVAAMGGEPLAGFSIGSFGASLDPTQAGALNDLLTPLLGDPVGLNVLSYQGLATANVRLGDLLGELELLSSDNVLAETVTLEEVILASADVLRRNGDVANANLLDGLITPEIQEMPPVAVGDLLHIGQGGETAALESDVNVLGLITGSAFLSKCEDPTDLGSCTGFDLPGVDIVLPGLSVDGQLHIIQGAQSYYGPEGPPAVHTNQFALNVEASIGAQELGRCVPTGLGLNCLLSGLGNLLGFLVDATATVEANIRLAEGTAMIQDIDCAPPLGLDISTNTGLYEMDVTVRLHFVKKTLLGVLLGGALGDLVLQFSTESHNAGDLAQFDFPPDILKVTVEETGGGSIGLSNVALTPGPDSNGLLQTLVNLGVTTGVGPILTKLINPLLNELDNEILGPLTDTLGLNVTGSDITPERIDCFENVPKLVG